MAKKKPQIIIFLKKGNNEHGRPNIQGIDHIMADQDIDVVVIDGPMSKYYLKEPWEKHGRLRKHQNFPRWDILIPKWTVAERKVRDFMEKFRSDILRGRIEGRWKGKTY